MTVLMAGSMAKKRSDVMTRISLEARKLAEIAASYEGITLVEYISRVVKQAAERDAQEGHARQFPAKPKKN